LFFMQAEVGIRAFHVTGVQTCALPISRKAADKVGAPAKWSGTGAAHDAVWGECAGSGGKRYRSCVDVSAPAYRCDCPSRKIPCKIGRASCRERAERCLRGPYL